MADVISVVSNIRRTSNAKVENVDSPPQKPHVNASLRCGGIFGWSAKNPAPIPRIRLARIFTHNVAGAEANCVLTTISPVMYLKTAPVPPPINIAIIFARVIL